MKTSSQTVSNDLSFNTQLKSSIVHKHMLVILIGILSTIFSLVLSYVANFVLKTNATADEIIKICDCIVMSVLFLLAEAILVTRKGHEAQNHHLVHRDSLIPSIIIFVATGFSFGTSMLLEFLPTSNESHILMIFMINFGIVIVLLSLSSMLLFHVDMSKKKEVAI
jgi:uncharacterized membrane protein